MYKRLLYVVLGLSVLMVVGSVTGQAKTFTKEDLARSNFENGVSFEVIYLNPLVPEEYPDRIAFQVFGTTHSGDISKEPYTEKVQVRTSDGIIADQVEWVWVQKSSHHPEARLSVKKIQKNGQPLITKQTQFIEIHFQNIARVKDRVFKWENKDGLEFGMAKIQSSLLTDGHYNAYISNASSGTISIFDIEKHSEIKRIRVGEKAI